MHMAEKTLSNQSIEKLFQIVEVMAERGKPMRLYDVSKICGISASTALRILNTVIQCGYAKQDPETQLYSLTYRFVKIGNQVRQSSSLNQILHPYLVEITNKLELSSATAVWGGGGVVYTDEVVPTNKVNMIRINHHLGHMFPANQSAAGKLMLSQLSKPQLRKYLSEYPLQASTPNSITSTAELEAHLAQVRAQGYALNNEEAAYGMRCIAIPVRNSDGGIIATISVSGTVYQISSERMAMDISIMKALSQRIEQEYQGLFPAADFPSVE